MKNLWYLQIGEQHISVYGSEKKINSYVVHMKRNADDRGIKLGESLAVRKKASHLISKTNMNSPSECGNTAIL